MINENEFYQRQIKLPFVKMEGQEKLKNSRVLIVGAGGLGHPVATMLAGSGVGSIGIADFDIVSSSNLHRQFLFNPSHVGLKKTVVLADFIRNQNPFIKVQTFSLRINNDNIENIFKDYDIIVDCCDNLSTKFLLHDTAYRLKLCLVQGAIDQIEGEIKVFDFKNDISSSPCLRCLWPVMPDNDCVQSCSEVGVMPSTAGVFGTLMANEIVKVVLNLKPLISGTTYQLNLATLESRKIKWKKNEACPLCNKSVMGIASPAMEIELERKTISNFEEFLIIDLKDRMLLASEVDVSKKYLLVCDRGVQSMRMAKILQEEGHLNVWSLAGGRACL